MKAWPIIRRPLNGQTPSAALAALFVLLAGGLLIANAGHLGVVVSTAGVAILLAFAFQKLVPRSERKRYVALVCVALGTRAVVAASFSLFSPTGFFGGDDQSYAAAASLLADYVRGEEAPNSGPPVWAGYAYLMTTYVYLVAAFIVLFGEQLLGMQIINAGLMIVAALLLSDMARRLFGSRAAWVTAATIVLYPSLVLWSSLNLKDSLALLLVSAVLWIVQTTRADPRAAAFALCFPLLLVLEDVRRFVFIVLAIAIPLGVALSFELRSPGRRLAWTAGAVLGVAAVMTITGASIPTELGPIENIRRAMARSARTGYVEAPASTMVTRPGDSFVVLLASPLSPPAPTSDPGTPRRVVVPPNSQLVMASEASSKDEPVREVRPGVYEVRPGDVVIVGSQDPSRTLRPLVLARAEASATQATVTMETGDSLTRTIAHLPLGTVYALFAPFPWDARRVIDVLTIPDMLGWYAMLLLAVQSVWHRRSQWRVFVPMGLYVAGIIGVFAIAEGNTGTLFRHRAMVLPLVVVLASPALAGVADSSVWRLGAVARRLLPAR